MRILMLTDGMDIGGAETHISSLALGLTRLGHTVVICSPGGASAKRLCEAGITHLTLPLASHSPISMLICYRSLLKIAKNGSFDVIHSHARLPSLIAHLVSRRLSVRHVTTVHARFTLSPIRRRLSRWGTLSSAVSQDLKQYLIDSYSIPPENIWVIPNGIDTSLFYPESDRQMHVIPKIGTLSRLDRDCSLSAVMLCSIAPRLCAELGRIERYIGGAGEMLSAISQIAKDTNRHLGFECIRICGQVNDVPSFMRSCDIFVGVSRAALEALMCGCTVIVCGNEGFFGHLTKENISSASLSNFCARGYPLPTSEKLFESLYPLCKEQPARRHARATSLFNRASLIFDSRVMVKDTVKLYEKALAYVPCKAPDILLFGYYGFGNMGDDALLRSAISRARRQYPSMSLGALTKGGYKDSDQFGVSCFRRSSLLALCGKIRRCGLFIIGGGTLLQDDTSLRSLLYYCSVISLAKRCGAKVLLWSNGLGVPHSPFSRRIMSKALSSCDLIGLRDRASEEICRSLCPGISIKNDPDMALSLTAAPSQRCEYLLWRVWGEAHPEFIIATPRPAEGIKELELALQEAVGGGVSVCYVAMHEKEDLDIVRRLCTLIPGVIIRGIGYSDLVSLCSISRGIYSMRLHGLIAAASAGVPYRAFGSDPKLKAFIDKNV